MTSKEGKPVSAAGMLVTGAGFVKPGIIVELVSVPGVRVTLEPCRTDSSSDCPGYDPKLVTGAGLLKNECAADICGFV